MKIFDVVLSEEKQTIYAIGDSHAVAIGTAGGFVKYAANGRSAFSQENKSAVDEVKPGSIVVLSAGTNDMSNQNKTSVIQNIESLLNKLINVKKCTVWFVLPGATDAPAFIGYKDQLRNELAKQIPDDFPTIKMLDIGQLSIKTGDGIHAPQSWYQSAAKQIAGTAKETAQQSGQDSTNQTANTQNRTGVDLTNTDAGAGRGSPEYAKKDPRRTDLPTAPTFEVPAGRYGPEVKKLQMALMSLGYPVGPDKDDGKFGKNTQAAVLKFQKDNKLEETGKFDEATVKAITSAFAEKHKRHLEADALKPSTSNKPQAPGQSGMVPPGTKPTGKPAEMSAYMKEKGLSDKHRAGILANIEAESNFDIGNTTGDKGRSWGLFQWQNYVHPRTGRGDRRRDRMVQAVPDWKSNWKGQIDYALSEPEGRTYANRSFGSAEEAAYWWCYYFERPKDKASEAKKRERLAKKYL